MRGVWGTTTGRKHPRNSCRDHRRPPDCTCIRRRRPESPAVPPMHVELALTWPSPVPDVPLFHRKPPLELNFCTRFKT